MVTRELLERTIAGLRQQRTNGLAQAEQAFGAITLAEFLLKQFEEEAPAETGKEPDGGSDNAPA